MGVIARENKAKGTDPDSVFTQTNQLNLVYTANGKTIYGRQVVRRLAGRYDGERRIRSKIDLFIGRAFI